LLLLLVALLLYSFIGIMSKSKLVIKELIQTNRNVKVSAFEGIVTDRN
jgi:hypothetical protein